MSQTQKNIDKHNREVMSGGARRILRPQKPPESSLTIQPETRIIADKKYYRDIDGMWKPGNGKAMQISIRENENDISAVEFIGDAIEQLLNAHANAFAFETFETLQFNTKTLFDPTSPPLKESLKATIQSTSKEELVNNLINAGYNFESTVVTDHVTNDQKRETLQHYPLP